MPKRFVLPDNDCLHFEQTTTNTTRWLDRFKANLMSITSELYRFSLKTNMSREMGHIVRFIAEFIDNKFTGSTVYIFDFDPVKIEKSSPYAQMLLAPDPRDRIFELDSSDRLLTVLATAGFWFTWLGVIITEEAPSAECLRGFGVVGNRVIWADIPELQFSGSRLEVYVWDDNEIFVITPSKELFSEICDSLPAGLKRRIEVKIKTL